MLRENLNLEFVHYDDIDGEYFLKAIEKGILLSENKRKERFSIDINDKWRLVQQPVQFIDAVKAIDEGKTIQCKYINNYVNKGDIEITHTYKPKCNGLLQDEKGDSPTLWMMLKAKWYIKEED